jgi:pimeloyl-ACP methyl ester carboxylesterase
VQRSEATVEPLDFTTPDGVALQALFRYDGVSSDTDRFKALVVTIHEEGGDSRGWDPAAALFAREGCATVRWDLRGHRSDAPKRHETFDEADWVRCADDLVQVVHATQERAGVDTPVILAGEGYGALLALDHAKRRGGVAGVVMVSPPREAHGLDGVALIADFRVCPVLILASENDATRYPAAIAIQEAAPEFSEIRVYPGAARGVGLLLDKPDSLQQIAGWLDIVLQPTTPT